MNRCVVTKKKWIDVWDIYIDFEWPKQLKEKLHGFDRLVNIYINCMDWRQTWHIKPNNYSKAYRGNPQNFYHYWTFQLAFCLESQFRWTENLLWSKRVECNCCCQHPPKNHQIHTLPERLILELLSSWSSSTTQKRQWRITWTLGMFLISPWCPL